MQEPNVDKKAQLRRLQSDLLILESDLRRNERKKSEIQMMLKKLKHQRDLLIIEIKSKEDEIKKIDSNQFIINEDIKMLKKKINLL